MSEEIRPHIHAFNAIWDGDLKQLKKLIATHPELMHYQSVNGSCMSQVGGTNHISIAEYLYNLGVDINHTGEDSQCTALTSAVNWNQLEMTRFLLSNGADPNIGRPLMGAVQDRSEDEALEYIKLLVEHGADVNRTYVMFGDKNNLITALDWCGGFPKIAAYLREHGAKTYAELTGQPPKPETTSPEDARFAIINYFDSEFGKPSSRSLIEIVPVEPAIEVHVIPATRSRKHITLFTTGMSFQPMTLPAEIDGEFFKFAELFIQLPGDWPYQKLEDPNYGWPVYWLRKLAKFPHHQNTWLNGQVMIMRNDERDTPIAPPLRFDSMLVLAEREFQRKDRKNIHLYRLMPLYPEERLLGEQRGFNILMQALDRHNVPFVFDPQRINAGVPAKK